MLKAPIFPIPFIANAAKQFVCVVVAITFLMGQGIGPIPAYAQDFRLPAPGVMVRLSPEFNPPILKGIKVHPDNPFRFDFILDQGDSLPLVGGQGRGISNKKPPNSSNISWPALTIPEKDLWVNLSPL